MISYCGIDCSKCETFLATRTNSDKERKNIAEKCLVEHNVKLNLEEINCHGCKSDKVKCSFAEDLCAIRKCNIEKSTPHCAACAEYKCDQLKKIIESAPVIGQALKARL
jgi:hypothetical protein